MEKFINMLPNQQSLALEYESRKKAKALQKNRAEKKKAKESKLTII
jgi:hypothetical protein